LRFNPAELILVESKVTVVLGVNINHVFQMSGQLLVVMLELKNLRLSTFFFTLEMKLVFLKLLARLDIQLSEVLEAGFKVLDFFLLLYFFFSCCL